MGALAGHIQHIYENNSLTISEVQKILLQLCENKLSVTEKIDGINFYFTCDKNKRIRFARNKYDILDNKGLTLTDLQSTNKQYTGNLKEILLSFVTTLQKSISNITDEDINNTFKDGNLFYNSEIISNKFVNIYEYEKQGIIIHPSLHIMYHKGESIEKTITASSIKSLKGTLNTINETYGETFIQINPKIHIPKNNLQEKIENFFSTLLKNNKILNKNSTLLEYYTDRLFLYLRQQFPQLSDELLLQISHALHKNSSNLDNIAIDSNIISQITENKQYFIYKSKKELVIFIENISQQLLDNIKSNFISNPEQQSITIKQNIDKLMRNMSDIALNNPKIYNLLVDYQESLKDYKKNNFFCEGLVFFVGEDTYKVTGLFSKINKLYNLSKNTSNTAATSPGVGRKIAIFAGSFKPPHRGHFEIVKNIADKVDFVNVYVSPLSRNHKNFSFDPNISAALWRHYLNTYKISNVNIILSEFSSPITMVYNFLINDKNLPNLAQKNDKIYILVSTKDLDARYADLENYNKHNSELFLYSFETIIDKESSFETLSSTSLRKSIAEKNLALFSTHLPELCRKEAQQIMNYLYSASKMKL